MINEIFEGIQGEGKTQGQYRTFIRMNTCNLCCSFCDTKYALGVGDKQVDLKINYPRIVITGGEPILPNNWQNIIHNILYRNDIEWVEIETNGTIIPSCFGLVDLWNISPKNPKDMLNQCDCTPRILEMKDELHDYIVKFVVKDESDIEFVKLISDSYHILNNRIWLMPYTHSKSADSGKSIETLNKETSEFVYDICANNKWNFSARLHVMIKGNKRGI